ncbi:hypothetical protein HD554DRAFT_2326062 [Boletus coccyginus]|nr:hypothetical protein HD554DRAFT_2326062 [Boletus coccyginus]
MSCVRSSHRNADIHMKHLRDFDHRKLIFQSTSQAASQERGGDSTEMLGTGSAGGAWSTAFPFPGAGDTFVATPWIRKGTVIGDLGLNLVTQAIHSISRSSIESVSGGSRALPPRGTAWLRVAATRNIDPLISPGAFDEAFRSRSNDLSTQPSNSQPNMSDSFVHYTHIDDRSGEPSFSFASTESKHQFLFLSIERLVEQALSGVNSGGCISSPRDWPADTSIQTQRQLLCRPGHAQYGDGLIDAYTCHYDPSFIFAHDKYMVEYPPVIPSPNHRYADCSDLSWLWVTELRGTLLFLWIQLLGLLDTPPPPVKMSHHLIPPQVLARPLYTFTVPSQNVEFPPLSSAKEGPFFLCRWKSCGIWITSDKEAVKDHLARTHGVLFRGRNGGLDMLQSQDKRGQYRNFDQDTTTVGLAVEGIIMVHISPYKGGTLERMSNKSKKWEERKKEKTGNSHLDEFVRDCHRMPPCGQVLHLARTWGCQTSGLGIHGPLQPLKQAVVPPVKPRAPTQAYAHGDPGAKRLARDNEVVALLRDGQLRPTLSVVEPPARKTKFETRKRHRL